MLKKQLKPPAYCLHQASGQAVVRIHGRDRYQARRFGRRATNAMNSHWPNGGPDK